MPAVSKPLSGWNIRDYSNRTEARAQVRRVLFAEYAALGLLAALLAISLAALGGWALVRFTFDARFVLPAAPLAGLALGVVVLTLLVGLWGSADVYRRTPVEVLRAE